MQRILCLDYISTTDFSSHPAVTGITDIQLAMRENEDLMGQGRSVDVSRDYGLRCRTEPIVSSLKT